MLQFAIGTATRNTYYSRVVTQELEHLMHSIRDQNSEAVSNPENGKAGTAM